MKKFILFLLAFGLLDAHAQKIDVKVTESYSPYIFGHNLEHTRSAINGGLSAQMLKNRKFAGKPQSQHALGHNRREGILRSEPKRCLYKAHLPA